MSDFRQAFIQFAIERNVLCFGEFKTKAGRMSPYFFNAGLFNDGDSLRKLGQFYAKAIVAAELPIDMLFGPAYKGIPLVSTIAITTIHSALIARKSRIMGKAGCWSVRRWPGGC